MSDRDPLLLSSYDYHLPQEQIATYPASPKDSARLLIYHRKSDTITHAHISDLLTHLPPECAVILNNTKVIKARLFGNKESGAKIELLLNSPLDNDCFSVYIRGRVKPHTLLLFEHDLRAKILSLESDGTRIVQFSQNDKILNFEQLIDLLETIGHTPLPPYIKRQDTAEDATLYQPLFAKHRGAVAAPTASLHFTPELFEALQARHDTHYITLHVGAGTFKPVEVEDIKAHQMHREFYEISPSAKTLIEGETPILAVGTTVTRTIEYYVRTHQSAGACDLFLHPHNPPQRVNHLLTNFHLPKSTLLMLVASFIGLQKTHELYQEAIDNGYRFYSYGDAMLIL